MTGKERGLQLKNLSTATVRSVACGVFGVFGMFIGAVLLAISYQVFMEWVNCKDDGDGAGMEQAESAGQDGSAGSGWGGQNRQMDDSLGV